MEKLTIEQKIVKHLAAKGYITHVGDVLRSLKDPEYAELLIIGTTGEIPDINDDGSVDGDCDHEALSEQEIQEVFDNDYEKGKTQKNKLN
jgi:hypothetical protein